MNSIKRRRTEKQTLIARKLIKHVRYEGISKHHVGRSILNGAERIALMRASCLSDTHARRALRAINQHNRAFSKNRPMSTHLWKGDVRLALFAAMDKNLFERYRKAAYSTQKEALLVLSFFH